MAEEDDTVISVLTVALTDLNAMLAHRMLCFEWELRFYLTGKNVFLCCCCTIAGAVEIVTALSTQINIQQVQAHLWCLSNGVL